MANFKRRCVCGAELEVTDVNPTPIVMLDIRHMLASFDEKHDPHDGLAGDREPRVPLPSSGTGTVAADYIAASLEDERLLREEEST
jgi:hypothetical protein